MKSGPELLLQWIERMGFDTHMDAAVALGFHFSFISHLLAGRRRPSLNNAVKIERISGIPVAAWAPASFGRSVLSRRAKAKNMQTIRPVNA